MWAVGLHAFGGPDVLGLIDLPVPVPGPGEIRVRVHAAAVNPTDVVRRSGLRAAELADTPFPHVLGMDFAGMIDLIGPHCDTVVRQGDAVMGLIVPSGANGAYAEQVVVPAQSVTRTPRGSSFAEAATVPMNGLTAALALRTLSLPEGQWLAVTGAAGALGGYCVQLATRSGLNVVADASDADRGIVEAFGAKVVLQRGDGFAERVREALPDGAGGLVDAATLDENAGRCVRTGGRVVTVRGYRGSTAGDVEYHPILVYDMVRDTQALDDLRCAVESGHLTPRVARTFSPENAAAAHQLLEAGGVRGRPVLEFQR